MCRCGPSGGCERIRVGAPRGIRDGQIMRGHRLHRRFVARGSGGQLTVSLWLSGIVSWTKWFRRSWYHSGAETGGNRSGAPDRQRVRRGTPPPQHRPLSSGHKPLRRRRAPLRPHAGDDLSSGATAMRGRVRVPRRGRAVVRSVGSAPVAGHRGMRRVARALARRALRSRCGP